RRQRRSRRRSLPSLGLRLQLAKGLGLEAIGRPGLDEGRDRHKQLDLEVVSDLGLVTVGVERVATIQRFREVTLDLSPRELPRRLGIVVVQGVRRRTSEG